MSYRILEDYYEQPDLRPHFYVGNDNTKCTFRDQQTVRKMTSVSDDDDSDSLCEAKQIIVGVCAMAKKSGSKPMVEILTRLQEFEYLKTIVFSEHVILTKPVEEWPLCDCLISFHSKGFPLAKAIEYAQLREPLVLNDLHMQYDIQDRRKVYKILEEAGIELPRYGVLDRDSSITEEREFVECEDHIEINGDIFNKPFVEKPISAEDHNIYIYYPTSAGGGSQRLFRKIGSRSSVYSPESKVRKTGSYIYEEFMPTDGTDVKVYTVSSDYAHAEARKSPALDGKVERDQDGKEIRYPVILSNSEKLIARQVCLAFKQTVCGFDLLRANGKSYVCDVNGFSFVKNSPKYYDDCAKIMGNYIMRSLAPQLHIPWSVPFQLDDPPIVPTTFGKMMELRCVIAIVRHGDRTPKQKMKMEVKHRKFFELFERLNGYKDGHVKIKKPKQLQEILDISRFLVNEIETNGDAALVDEDFTKLEQLKSVLEMYGHFSGINRKVQMKYQPRGRPRRSSSEEGPEFTKEPSLVLILKWGGELTPAGRVQAEELGRVFRCMYPGGPPGGSHEGSQGEYGGNQGLGLLRLHSTFRHDLKIYASDEGRVQMTAAAFAKGLLALEGELTPILVQMVKSANTNGLLDYNDCDSSNYQSSVKGRLHETMQSNNDLTEDDIEKLNPTKVRSVQNAIGFIKNPYDACQRVYDMVVELNELIKSKKEDPRISEYKLYYGETWELMYRRWSKLEKDFKLKDGKFDLSKIPDIYDCVKYDWQHNQHTLQFLHLEQLYMFSKALADVVIPQEYGMSKQEKLTIGLGVCAPLLKKIRCDLLRNQSEDEEETEAVNRLNPRYLHGVSSPGRHVTTRLYFTSESHIHSLLTVLRFGGLVDAANDEQWRRAMEYVSAVSELNYMTQIVIMLYEDPSKDVASDERFHVELHFSPGVVCCVQKNIPVGPGFRPHNKGALKKYHSSNNSEKTNAYSKQPIEEESDDLIEHDKTLFFKCTRTAFLSKSVDSSSILDEPSIPATIPEETAEEKTRPKSTEPIAINVQPSSQYNSTVDLEKPAFPLVRSHSVTVTSSVGLRPHSLEDESTLENEMKSEKTSPHAQSLNDVSNCENPNCQLRTRHQRHSIPVQLSSYLRLCSVADLPHYGSTNSLFSTAVISGSASAPDLKDILHTSVDGCPTLPSIRPLETLHNALSLKQLDIFLQKVTSSRFISLPQESKMKLPVEVVNSSGQYVPSTKSGCSTISPNSSFAWSGPPSYVSSSGPSSPNWSQFDTRYFARNGSEVNLESGAESFRSYSDPPSPCETKVYNAPQT
ncbi:Inositol hexakisphosphate and diphosphoinositol-pentakisphosphate kinase [Halotydeus destructor]|nr:Inositol hexakisphosphate and diphosphoinositol-pentakisphosphate kinase [Halotydeus destructor]